jgi:hypothetical protein
MNLAVIRAVVMMAIMEMVISVIELKFKRCRLIDRSPHILPDKKPLILLTGPNLSQLIHPIGQSHNQPTRPTDPNPTIQFILLLQSIQKPHNLQLQNRKTVITINVIQIVLKMRSAMKDSVTVATDSAELALNVLQFAHPTKSSEIISVSRVNLPVKLMIVSFFFFEVILNLSVNCSYF